MIKMISANTKLFYTGPMRLRSHLLQHRDINFRNNMRRLRNCVTVMRMLKLREIY